MYFTSRPLMFRSVVLLLCLVNRVSANNDKGPASSVSSFVRGFSNESVKPLFNVADAVRLANASSMSPHEVPEHEITFVVMGSSKTREKVAALKGTWGKEVSNLYVFSDEDDEELQPIVLDQCRGKSTREDAQHKTLLGSKYVFEHSKTPQARLMSPLHVLFQRLGLLRCLRLLPLRCRSHH